MVKKEILERIVESAGIKRDQLDLIARVFELKGHDNRIDSVEVGYSKHVWQQGHPKDSSGDAGLNVEVSLKSGFRNKKDFREYLLANDLPDKEIKFTNAHCLSSRTYMLVNNRCYIFFFVPDRAQ